MGRSPLGRAIGRDALMLANRRRFLAGASALGITAAGAALAARSDDASNRTRPKAIAFDGFPIIDSRPIEARAEELFPGRGESLLLAWRTRQFEYTWLRTLGGRYVDFWQTTQDALLYAASSMG